jgi:hypothetical protein
VPEYLRRRLAAWRTRTRPETVVDVALSLAAATLNVVFALFADTENGYDLATRQPALRSPRRSPAWCCWCDAAGHC